MPNVLVNGATQKSRGNLRPLAARPFDLKIGIA